VLVKYSNYSEILVFYEDFIANFILILNIHVSYKGRMTKIKTFHLYNNTSQ